MICQSCGKMVQPNSKKCPNCGEVLLAHLPSLFDPRSSKSFYPPTLASYPSPIFSKPKELREWWHQILRDYERYNCYAFFLCLPSDEEAIKYITSFGKELDLLSNQNCLVIALSKNAYRCSGSNDYNNFHFPWITINDGNEDKKRISDRAWKAAINEQLSEGYSIKVAQLFKIKFTEFPCLVIFENIRSPKRIVFTFKGLTVEEISSQIRIIFSLIQQAVNEKNNPIRNLINHQKNLGLQKASQTIFDKILNLSGKTFEAAMEAWIKTVVK